MMRCICSGWHTMRARLAAGERHLKDRATRQSHFYLARARSATNDGRTPNRVLQELSFHTTPLVEVFVRKDSQKCRPFDDKPPLLRLGLVSRARADVCKLPSDCLGFGPADGNWSKSTGSPSCPRTVPAYAVKEANRTSRARPTYPYICKSKITRLSRTHLTYPNIYGNQKLTRLSARSSYPLSADRKRTLCSLPSPFCLPLEPTA